MKEVKCFTLHSLLSLDVATNSRGYKYLKFFSSVPLGFSSIWCTLSSQWVTRCEGFPFGFLDFTHCLAFSRPHLYCSRLADVRPKRRLGVQVYCRLAALVLSVSVTPRSFETAVRTILQNKKWLIEKSLSVHPVVKRNM